MTLADTPFLIWVSERIGDFSLVDAFSTFRHIRRSIQFVMPELDRCATLSTPESGRPALRQPSASPLRPQTPPDRAAGFHRALIAAVAWPERWQRRPKSVR